METDIAKSITNKTIQTIVSPPPPHMVGDGFKMHGFIPNVPGLDMRRMDPFLVLDYNPITTLEPSDVIRGVGVHPHRGFETVTISYHGSVAHHDSTGAGGVIHSGDIQWMTAASGVLHKEFHEASFSKKGGLFQMIQLWINLPAKDKMSSPKYQNITKDKIAVHALPDNMGQVDVIAGTYEGTKGPASTFSPIVLYNVRLNQGGKADFTIPQDFTTFLLVIEGEISVNEKKIRVNNLVLFDRNGTDFTIEADENTVVLLVAGQPLNEPIASYGPFVMNNEAEIKQAIEDFNSGKFGHLED